MFDAHATADAIAILNRKRIESAPLPYSVWRFLRNASERLDADLHRYFRGDDVAPNENSNSGAPQSR
jgi:hypothetical protein